MRGKNRSLKRPLIIYPLAWHLGTLAVSFTILLAIAVRFDAGGPYANEEITPVIAAAIARTDEGQLAVRMTPELAKLQANTGDLWFVAQDDAGHTATFGPVPPQYASLTANLNDLSYATMRERKPPYSLTAVVRREASAAGPLTILGHGDLTELNFIVLMASSLIVLPIFLLLVIMSLIVTPWIVNRALAGIRRIAEEAAQIDTDRRGRRLSIHNVPTEVVPLVRAMNDALSRLDEGYERQRRFIASAAHELRTPIAILRVKVETADEHATRSLARDVQRLATLAEQLLDLQRLDIEGSHQEIDLSDLVRRVAADLAPLLIATDCSIEVVIEDRQTCFGDSLALERVVTNLIQNAADHGGSHVIVRVLGTAFEVEDNGPGIPAAERERVFEPFHRLRPSSAGSGLGLSLVQQVVERHGGRVLISNGSGGGAIFRVELPSA